MYAEGIKKALEKQEVLRQILDKFRDEEHKIQGEWHPVSVFCDECKRDDTEIDGWDGDWALTYHCNLCGHKETVDLRTAKGVKLLWRVDWPMRWAYEKVDFEPAGKDHQVKAALLIPAGWFARKFTIRMRRLVSATTLSGLKE